MSLDGMLRPPCFEGPIFLFEDSEAGLDLSKVATDYLLREIRKRISPKMEEKNERNMLMRPLRRSV